MADTVHLPHTGPHRCLRACAPEFIVPDWPAPPTIRALQTTRQGGCSLPPYDSLNPADHVGDDLTSVRQNRACISQFLPAPPLWLQQVHGTLVVDADRPDLLNAGIAPAADAAFSRQPGRVCVIMTADCLPLLFCNRAGTVVAAAHAGWRGLCTGVIENTVAAMQVPAHELLVWLGPAIGPTAFEVGNEVREAFLDHDAAATAAFQPQPGQPDKWLADIFMLARQRLNALGVTAIYGGGVCTVSDPERFFSHRRSAPCGRLATLIWQV